MAYNFRNALVNLNEEIRKSGGGGGGQIPALQLAVSQLQVSVSQLQVSMADVKSSVVNVSSRVEAIHRTLTELSTYENTTDVTIGQTPDGKEVMRHQFSFDSLKTLDTSTATATDLQSSVVDSILALSLQNQNGDLRVAQADIGSTYVGLKAVTGNPGVLKGHIDYIKKAPTRKGGKK